MLLKNSHFLWIVILVSISLSLSSCFWNDDDGGSDNDKDDSSIPVPDTPPLIEDINLTVTYEYDDLNRVTKATYSNGKVVLYVYDQAGNIIEKTVE